MFVKAEGEVFGRPIADNPVGANVESGSCADQAIGPAADMCQRPALSSYFAAIEDENRALFGEMGFDFGADDGVRIQGRWPCSHRAESASGASG